MNDPRTWTFGDWLRLSFRAIPAILLALVLIVAGLMAVPALAWWLVPFSSR